MPGEGFNTLQQVGQAGGEGIRVDPFPLAGVTDRVITSKKVCSNGSSVFFSFLPFQFCIEGCK